MPWIAFVIFVIFAGVGCSGSDGPGAADAGPAQTADAGDMDARALDDAGSTQPDASSAADGGTQEDHDDAGSKLKKRVLTGWTFGDCGKPPVQCGTLIYDARGNKLAENRDDGCDSVIEYCERFTYDADDHQTTSSSDFGCSDSPEERSEYTYDAAGKLTLTTTFDDDTVAGTPASCTAFTYDAAGHLTKEKLDRYCDGTLDNCFLYSYDSAGRRTLQVENAACDLSYGVCTRYTYDAEGHPIGDSQDIGCNDSPDLCHERVYDASGALASDRSDDDCNGSFDGCNLYELAADGNLTTKKTDGNCDAVPESCYEYTYSDLSIDGEASVAGFDTQEAYLKAGLSMEGLEFGHAIAISGDTLVVGVPIEDDQSGAAYVFVRGSDGTWSQQAHLRASNAQQYDLFGQSVAIHGDTIVVGAYQEDSSAKGIDGDQDNDAADQAGAAYVFVRSGNTWSQQAYLKASNADESDQFGDRVAVWGDTVVVGAHSEDSSAKVVDGDQNDDSALNSGAAYVFVRSGSTWSQQAYIKASNADMNDELGVSLALYDDTLVVGATSEASAATGVNGNQADDSAEYSGAAYVFVRSGSTWTQQAYLKASNNKPSLLFGGSVAVSGDTLVVGSVSEDSYSTGIDGDQNDDLAADSGAAYVFVRSGSKWSQQAYVKASNTSFGDRFGTSVAIADDRLVVGSPNEASAATGFDGNQNDNSAPQSGAVYVFVRSGSKWSQQAFVKASNTGAADHFGSSVAITSQTLAVAAFTEGSSATGIDGDQSNDAAGASGAVYVFR